MDEDFNDDVQGSDKNDENSDLQGTDQNDDNSDYEQEGDTGNKII